MKFMVIVLTLWLQLGCFKSAAPIETMIVNVTEIAKEQAIPKVLMSQIESDVQTESKSITPLYFFVPLTVEFSELSDKVLKSPKMQFNLPKGGGEIDLKDVVIGAGSFFLSFPSSQFEKLPELTHLYYVSNSPITEVQKENFGLGCGKWIDLKSNFSKLQKSDFLKLNTSELRYLYVAAGTYIFVFRQGTQVSLTQLTVTDSRFTKSLCLGEPPHDK